MQSLHSPHPFFLQTRAAANARAITERPEPGGPVKSQACVISLPVSFEVRARSSWAMAASCPTRELKTGALTC